MSSLVIDRFTSLDQLQTLEADWNDLLAISGTDTIFLTFEWVTSWLRWIGRNAQPLILVAKDGHDKIVGLAPLMVTDSPGQGRSTRKVQFIGAPNSDYSDFVVPGDRTLVLQAFFRHLLRSHHDWNRIWLREIGQTSPTTPVLRGLSERRWFPALACAGSLCPTLILENHQDEIRRELARKKYIGKRDWNKSVEYAGRVGAVDFRHAATLEDAQALLPHLFRLHRQRWGGTSKFENQAYEDLYRALLFLLWPKGQVAVSAMTLDEKPIAVSFAFPYKGIWTNHTWVHDRDWGKFSPGTLLVHFMILDAMDRSYREFDFTRGAEMYKQRFSNQIRQNTDLVVYGDSREYLQVRLHQLGTRAMDQIRSHPRVHRRLQTVKRSVRGSGTS